MLAERIFEDSLNAVDKRLVICIESFGFDV